VVALSVAEQGAVYHLRSAAWFGLAEPATDPLTEAELSWIWGGQRFPPEALQAVDGRPLRILYPGRPGGGAGPDYLDAAFELGGELRRGDVELHVRASAWHGHGHATDPAYDRVALHVVFRADDGPDTALHSGARAPVAALEPWLAGRTEELKRWLAARALWQEPCKDARVHLGDDAVDALLREAGERRLRLKADALRVQVAAYGAEEALWRAILDSLGVGGDRSGFRRLAEAFPVSMARRLTDGLGTTDARGVLTAALAYVGGVGPLPFGLTGLPSPVTQALVSRGRPANRPQRRLAGLAGLYLRAGRDLQSHALGSVAAAGKAGALIASWQAAVDRVSLLGPDRGRELVLNVVLPFALLQPVIAEQAMALAGSLPAAPAYGKTRFLEANLAAGEGKRAVRGALAQQGLLSMLGEWCSQGGCGRCPLSGPYVRP